MTCGHSGYQYSKMSRLKFEVAYWHLDRLVEGSRIVPGYAPLLRFGRHRGLVPLVAAADGVVNELYGSFDAFACAVAHAYGFGGHQDKVSFRGIGDTSGPGGRDEVGISIRTILASTQWRDLSDLRHIASHRAVVTGSFRLGQETGAEIYLERQGASTGKGTDLVATLDGLSPGREALCGGCGGSRSCGAHQTSSRSTERSKISTPRRTAT